MKTLLRAYGWLPVAILVIAVVLYQFVDPAPPREITIATGVEGGRYHEMGKLLQSALAQEGVEVRLVETAGSSENLELLTDGNSPVSLAFVQSGVGKLADLGDADLNSLGSLYYEPIWLFYRAEQGHTLLTSFEGARVAVGERGSGTYPLARFLLESNGLLDGEGLTLVEKGGEEAVEMLKEGTIDAAFFNVSAQSKTIQALVQMEGVELMDVRRSESYTARFPSLSGLTISEGLLDLPRNVPATDRRTLASAATLVVNERFHPSFTPLVLEAVAPLLKNGGILEKPGQFPTGRYVDFPLTKEADHYFEYGPPFLLRYMPFWAASLVDRLVIFVIPLLVVIIPLSKLAGPLYRWRIRSRIYRWYRHLLDIEKRIAEGELGDDVHEEHRKVREIWKELDEVEVPLSYADELYHLKEHVEYVSRRLDGAEHTPPAGTAE